MNQNKCKVGLAIIAKDEVEQLQNIIESYGVYFDEIHIAIDISEDELEEKIHCIKSDNLNWNKCNFHKYEWQNDFAHKRNFLRDKCIGAGLDYYFTIDTDDEIVGIENLENIANRAKELDIDIVYCPYNYSHDENGNVDSVHNKERLVKCTKKLEWNKSIHENILPATGYQHKIVIDDRIVIEHLATSEDLKESHDRNMHYLIDEYKRDGDETDARTIAYLGRCYMSQQEFGKAIHFLELHVSKSGWNEDRYMSLCQLSSIHHILKGYDKAKYCALEALDILPTYPDATACLHDIYLSTENYPKAIYWGEETIKRKHPDTFIMIDPSRFGWRLAMSMSYAYIMNDMAEQAWKFFCRAESMAPNVDYIKNNKQWYEEAYEHKKFIDSFAGVLAYTEKVQPEKVEELVKAIPDTLNENEMIHRLRSRYIAPTKWHSKSITILCGDAMEPWAPPLAETTGIGGSEEAVIYLTQELVKQGWDVTVYNNCAEMEGEYCGVKYVNLYKLNPGDFFNILISWRSNCFADNTINAKMKCVWLHDIIAGGILDKWKQIDRIFVLSEYHKSLLPKDIPDYKVFVTSNGISIDEVPDIQREPKRIIYASSYDRGLELLLTNWPMIRSEVPEAELHIFYGWQNIERLISTERMTDVWYNKMKNLMKQAGVTEHGRVSHSRLHEEFAKSRIWAYPSNFPEISCITAMKAQYLGCLPVCTDYAALKETVKSGVVVEGSTSDKQVMDKYTKLLIDALKSDQTALPCTHDFSWSKVAEQWTDLFINFKKKMREYKDYEDYKNHYIEHSPEIGHTVGSGYVYPRIIKVTEWAEKYKVKTCFDIGTYDGALPVYMAERLDVECVALDANINHIQAGIDYVKKNNLNVKFIPGTLLEEYESEDKYDLVSANEIIEHVIDVDLFLEKCKSFVKDDGYFVVSTPLVDGVYGIYNLAEDHEHIRTYSEEQILTDVKKHFDVVEIDNDNTIITVLCKKKGN